MKVADIWDVRVAAAQAGTEITKKLLDRVQSDFWMQGKGTDSSEERLRLTAALLGSLSGTISREIFDRMFEQPQEES